MKPSSATLATIAVLAVSPACRTMPDGSKKYVGPTISFSASFKGVGAAIKLYGEDIGDNLSPQTITGSNAEMAAEMPVQPKAGGENLTEVAK